MSTNLINFDELGIQETDEQAQAEFTSSGSYLPSLRVYGSASTIVKESKFPQGHFGLYFTADKILDLGEQVDVLIIHYRPRASIMLSDEQPISYFNPESANFNEIKTKAQIKGKDKPQGYMFGLEYLLWVPSVQHFSLFFMGTPTLRRESSDVLALKGNSATFKIKFIPSKQYGGWHGMETLSCDAPFEIPPNDVIKNVYYSKFANPRDSEIHVTDEGDEADRAR